MRNDSKDEPLDILNLTIDANDPIDNIGSTSYVESKNKKKHGFSTGFVICMLLFLFIVYSIGVGTLFWVFKQTTDDVREQLDKTTHSATQATEATFSELQANTKTNLENIRIQNKQLANQMNKVLLAQQAIVTQQSKLAERLVKVEQQVQTLTKFSDAMRPFVSDLASFKQSQSSLTTLSNEVKALQNKNFPQSIQSLQDDLLLLRSQLDKASNNDMKQQLVVLQTKLEKELQDVQTQLNTIRQQLNNRSPY